MAVEISTLILLGLITLLSILPMRRGAEEGARRCASFFLVFAASFMLRLGSDLTAGSLSDGLRAGSNAVFYAYPPLLLALVHEFRRVGPGTWALVGITFLAVAGKEVMRSLGLSMGPLPFETRAVAAVHLTLFNLYAAAVFLLGSKRRESVPQRRMASAGLATLLLAAASMAAFWDGYFAGASLSPLPWALLAGALVLFFIAFTPPAWILGSWRAREVERFVHDMQGLHVTERPERAGRLLCRAAERLMEQSTATAFLRTSQGPLVVVAEESTGGQKLQETHAEVGEALEHEPIPIIIERRPDLLARHHWLLEAFETDVLVVAPIDGATDRHGTLVMRLAAKVPFMPQTLRVIGAVTDLVGQAADLEKAVEERQQKEREVLEREREALEESSHLKSGLLANMSHELRTPLNSILGFSTVLHQGRAGKMDEEARAMIEDVLRSARQLHRLIDDILELAKAEAGRLEFEPRRVRLPAVAEEVLRAVRVDMEKKEHSLRLEVDPAVETVVVDPTRLKQVLYNYLLNAVKFTPEHGQIVVRVLPLDDMLRVEVSDTGIGIRHEDHQRLFQEFEQLDMGFSKRHQGPGLGLAIVKRLVEAQGGRVGAQSAFGKGSTFYAELPMLQDEGPPAAA